eukprot:SAG31_NODE_1498_length_8095_cov_9.582541_4_plen_192_part_00
MFVNLDSQSHLQAIKSGLNAAGIAVGLPSANISIRNITTHGRGGIAIGSEMSGGVKNVTISNVRLLGQRGVHMKTTRGRGGYIENITMVNVTAPAGIQLWSTYGSTIANGPWPHVGNITVIDTGLHTKCSLSCGRLPAAYCDSKSFHYQELSERLWSCPFINLNSPTHAVSVGLFSRVRMVPSIYIYDILI